jgi:hypothetical protein
MDDERLHKIARRVAAQKINRDLKWWGDDCHDPPADQAPQFWRRDIPERVYSEIVNGRNETVIKWHKPDLEEERGEFERTAHELGLDLNDLLAKAANGWNGPFLNDDWARLENSDSWKIESMQEAEHLANLRDKDLASIVGAISQGRSLPSPIVLLQVGGPPYLIAGNTRLMAARALGENPVVYYVDMASSSSPQSTLQQSQWVVEKTSDR